MTEARGVRHQRVLKRRYVRLPAAAPLRAASRMAPAVAEARPASGDGGSAFARALASGAQKQRDAALAALSRWLASRSEVDETEMLKLWKGLFYAMWHADKPAVQASLRVRAATCLCRASRTLRSRHAPRQADVAERMAAVLDSSQPEARRCRRSRSERQPPQASRSPRHRARRWRLPTSEAVSPRYGARDGRGALREAPRCSPSHR